MSGRIAKWAVRSWLGVSVLYLAAATLLLRVYGDLVAFLHVRTHSGVWGWDVIALGPRLAVPALRSGGLHTAWPASSPVRDAGFWLYVPTVVLAVVLGGLLYAMVAGATRGPSPRPSSWHARVTQALRRDPTGPGSGTRMATRRRDLADHIVRDAATAEAAGRLVVGTRKGSHGADVIAAPVDSHAIVFGSTRSGKSSELLVPQLLGSWPGPVLATSVKDDLLTATLDYRRSRGPVTVFDPTRSQGLIPPCQWSPVSAASTWDGAQAAASALVAAAATGGDNSAFFERKAAMLLGALLYAAHHAGRDMGWVMHELAIGSFDEATEVVAALPDSTGSQLAQSEITATQVEDDRTRANTLSTARSLLVAYTSEVVLETSRPGRPGVAAFDAEAFLTGGPATHYVVTSSADTKRFAGILAAHVQEIVDTAARLARQYPNGRLPHPVLLLLDEAANTAPVSDLAGLLSTAASSGVTIVMAWHDMGQLKDSYGPDRASTIVSNAKTRLFLRGIGCVQTAELATKLAGATLVDRESTSRSDRKGGGSTSESHQLQSVDLVTADTLREMPAGQALLISGSAKPALIATRPYYRDPVLKVRAGAS